MEEPKHIFRCPECSTKLRVAKRQLHLDGPCPSCGATIRAAEPEENVQTPPGTIMHGSKPESSTTGPVKAASPVPSAPAMSQSPPPSTPVTEKADKPPSAPPVRAAPSAPAAPKIPSAAPSAPQAPALTTPAETPAVLSQAVTAHLPTKALAPDTAETASTLSPRIAPVSAAAKIYDTPQTVAQTHFSRQAEKQQDGMSNGKAFLLLLLTLLAAAAIVFGLYKAGLLGPVESPTPTQAGQTTPAASQDFSPEIAVRQPSDIPIPANYEAQEKIANELPAIEIPDEPRPDDLPPILERVGQ